MNGKIKAISQYGVLMEGSENWLNWGKNKEVEETCKNLKKGEEVVYEAKNGYLNDIKKAEGVGVTEEIVGEKPTQAYWDAKDKRIIRQHSQEMALRYFELLTKWVNIGLLKKEYLQNAAENPDKALFDMATLFDSDVQ